MPRIVSGYGQSAFGAGLIGLAAAERAIAKKADLVMRAFIFEAYSRLTLKTPVDTGRARGNWQIGNTPAEPGGTDETDPTGGKALAKALSWRKYDDVVYITNGLAYIKRLENGWSQQAPQGMVRVTAQELKALAKTVATRVRMSQGVNRG
jgi:hypothetical protein